jgi:hypothetical protein
MAKETSFIALGVIWGKEEGGPLACLGEYFDSGP